MSTPILLAAGIPLAFWGGSAIAILIGVAAGFFAGRFTASAGSSSTPVAPDSSSSSAQNGNTVEQHFQACCDQLQQFESSSRQLADCAESDVTAAMLDTLLQHQTPVMAWFQKLGEWKAKLVRLASKASTGEPTDFEIRWTTPAVDDRTQLPNAASLQANLQALCEKGCRHQQSSGVLLIQLDWYPSLVRKYGEDAAHALLRQTSRVVMRQIDDADLICRIAEDTLAVLFPSRAADPVREQARRIRTAFREHRFQLPELNETVSLTGSFGLTMCWPGDCGDQVLARGQQALKQASRSGRNQLQVDGFAPRGTAVPA